MAEGIPSLWIEIYLNVENGVIDYMKKSIITLWLRSRSLVAHFTRNFSRDNLMIASKFHKYHGLGNDYLVLDPQCKQPMYTTSQIIRICDRNLGIGSDGILYGPLPSKKADFALEIWNIDGTEAEKSGNGLRIFARFLFDSGKVVSDKIFTVETKGGIVSCIVKENGQLITVDMGKITFHSKEIPVNLNGEAREVLGEVMEIDKEQIHYYSASIGNPHVVVPVETLCKDRICSLGPKIENYVQLFPNRTNVQFMKVVDRSNIEILIWERGVGYTLASGSSSCATAAVARKMGECDENITVHVPGGQIQINVSPTYEITMTASVSKIGCFLLDQEAFEFSMPQ